MGNTKGAPVPNPETPLGSRRQVARSRLLKVAVVLSTALLLALVSSLMFYGARPKGTSAWGRIMWNEGKSTVSFVTFAEKDLDGYTVLMIGGTSPSLAKSIGLRERRALGFSWDVPRQIGGGTWQLRIPYWFLIASAFILDVGCFYLLTRRAKEPNAIHQIIGRERRQRVSHHD